MVTKVEAAKEFIERTKGELKEKERVREMIGMFIETFGFMPDVLEWESDAGKRVLTAKAVEKQETIQTILGEKVVEVIFGIEEENLEETEWKMSEFTRGKYTVYKWRKYFKGFSAWVEIITE